MLTTTTPLVFVALLLTAALLSRFTVLIERRAQACRPSRPRTSGLSARPW